MQQKNIKIKQRRKKETQKKTRTSSLSGTKERQRTYCDKDKSEGNTKSPKDETQVARLINESHREGRGKERKPRLNKEEGEPLSVKKDKDIKPRLRKRKK